MKPKALIPICFLLVTGIAAKAQSAVSAIEGEPKVNVGIKAGFNSTMLFIDRISLGENELKNIQNNYKVGYFGALF